MKKLLLPLFVILALLFAFTSTNFSQIKKRKAKTSKTTQTKSKASVETTQSDSSPDVTKKNSRPDETGNADPRSAVEPETQPKKNTRAGDSKQNVSPEIPYKYFYQFSQPEFLVRKMVIEHNDDGKGKIIFEKKDVNEPITEPINISAGTLDKLRNYFRSLNFLDSTENYQSERHYAHLGVMKIRIQEGEKSREVEFDWSENKDAKALVDEYRKISDQFIWIFDMKLARDMQPLETPRMIERIETMVKQNWISDPAQLVPFLIELSNDERIPLIGRNRAAKIAKEIDKNSQKK